ncbi:MAG TPA: hypothetical protein VHV30_00075, partial [Polyangiaceae bacterium]|nr:hypothetical protein [Polyangiaceae bacterium]
MRTMESRMVRGAGGLRTRTDRRKRKCIMTTGKETGVAFAKTLIAGVKAHLSNATTVTFGSATYTTAQIEAFLQTLIDLRTAVDEAKAAAKAKISAEAAQTPALRSQVAALVLYVRATFGNSPDVLADFGITPKKAPTPLTIGQKATAAAKRAATRAARHTMGPKKKLAVKGAATV